MVDQPFRPDSNPAGPALAQSVLVSASTYRRWLDGWVTRRGHRGKITGTNPLISTGSPPRSNVVASSGRPDELAMRRLRAWRTEVQTTLRSLLPRFEQVFGYPPGHNELAAAADPADMRSHWPTSATGTSSTAPTWSWATPPACCGGSPGATPTRWSCSVVTAAAPCMRSPPAAGHRSTGCRRTGSWRGRTPRTRMASGWSQATCGTSLTSSGTRSSGLLTPASPVRSESGLQMWTSSRDATDTSS